MQLQDLYRRVFDRSKPDPELPPTLPYLPDDEDALDTDALVIQPPFSAKRQKHMGYIAVVGSAPARLLSSGLLYGLPTPSTGDGELRAVDLPSDTRGALGVLYDLEYADLILFVIDTHHRISSEQLRWMARMRELDIPLIILLESPEGARKPVLPRLLAALEERLHVPVVPVYHHDYAVTRTVLIQKLFHLSPRLAAMLSLHAPLLRPILVEHLLNTAAYTSLDLHAGAADDEELSPLGEAQLRLARQLKAVFGRGARLSRQEYEMLLPMATAVTHYTNNLLKSVPTRNHERRTRLANAVSTLLIGYMTMIFHGETPPDIRKEILPHIWRLYRASGQMANQ